MTQYLLDTSVIIDILNDRHNRFQLIKKLLDQGNSFSCCSINVAEIYAGMRAKERHHTENFLNSLYCYDITRPIAVQAGDLKQEWSKRGITLSLADTIIASVAIAHSLILMTDNQKHYPMPELTKFTA